MHVTMPLTLVTELTKEIMSTLRTVRIRTAAFLLASLASVVLGSVLQSQLNLVAISAIGPAITWQQRIDTTLHDLIHFSPLFALVVLLTFALALPCAHFVARYQKRQFASWCMVAGAVGLWVAYQVLNNLAPMPTLIAATRGGIGTLIMLLPGILGGYVYARLTRSIHKITRSQSARKKASSSASEQGTPHA
ncbi:hypothetical protein [Aliidiomarina celeris]|uniref:hypothetical protein n=1 Tax=Aliidiomarina celeris TaxID=2249428 RepID=UPI000DE8C9B9|nr:hypothetical protein [Aliidiomarina celeris]